MGFVKSIDTRALQTKGVAHVHLQDEATGLELAALTLVAATKPQLVQKLRALRDEFDTLSRQV